MKEMCAECGADLRETDQRSQTAAVAMVHNIPELMVSMKVYKKRNMIVICIYVYLYIFRKPLSWVKKMKNVFLKTENWSC
jgi:hypothetical protein